MTATRPEENVLILDFGSQYAQLIARRVREQGVYSEIVSHRTPVEEIRQRAPRGLVLSGGPCSVYAEDAPSCDPELFRLGVPVLGICYGMQLGCQTLGGRVGPADSREYGRTTMRVLESAPLFDGLDGEQTVWMSHGDAVSELEGDFVVLAESDHSPYAAVRHATEPFFGLQFHPEVSHTPGGSRILRNFLLEVCGLSGDWRMTDFRRVAVEACREQVGDAHVVLGLSGGVDSAVVAALVYEAIGDRLHSIFVDNGLLRERESEQVVQAFADHEHFDLTRIDATDRFLDALAGVTDPEEKRKRIGHVFIDVFEDAAKAFPDVKFLAQGTLYPDVIESVPAHGGPTAKIKSHHNVGGLPETLGFELLEPLRYLFKDEVRLLGQELGLPESILWRQPFPGPGLAIRIAGDITRERLEIVRQADTIVRHEIEEAGLTRVLWQALCVLVPVQTVGVMGDERTYEDLIAVRAVESADGMTADWARLPAELLDRIANRIIGEVRGVNRVVYDITSKPPGTIEWE